MFDCQDGTYERKKVEGRGWRGWEGGRNAVGGKFDSKCKGM